jgi:hypothetical protein
MDKAKTIQSKLDKAIEARNVIAVSLEILKLVREAQDIDFSAEGWSNTDMQGWYEAKAKQIIALIQ